MNCIVVDDNKLARESIIYLISQVEFLTLKQECDNPLDAFNYLQKEQVDLVFLDVEMPEISGIELIKNLEKRPIIILITAKKEYAVEAFELNIADYIVKPVRINRFLAAVSKAKELFESKDVKIDTAENDINFIFVKSKSVLSKIKINDILYIQAFGDYVNIFTLEKRFTVHITLSGIVEKLPSYKFFRSHRSYLIALDHIDRIEDGTAYINKTPIPVSEQFRQSLLKKINFI